MMNRLYLILFACIISTTSLSAQKLKIIGVFQLIEKGKYSESKDIIEDALDKKSTQKWPRTWYARGVLCQTAYKDGIEKNDKKLYELYPDQVYVTYRSFEHVRNLDRRGRYNKRLSPKYVVLANDLIQVGNNHYHKKEYDKAFRAYDHANSIYNIKMLSLRIDTNLLYNCALSAFKNENWRSANKYLAELNEFKYSSNIPHLMYSIYMIKQDTVQAKGVLLDGIERYDDHENLVLLLVDLLYKSGEFEMAVNTLDTAFKKDSANYTYPYTKGLLYQKNEEYNKAIKAFNKALSLPSDTLKIYIGIGNSFYNKGAEINAKARTITNINRYQKEHEKSDRAFYSAIEWYEKAYELDQEDDEIKSKLIKLYGILDVKDKAFLLE